MSERGAGSWLTPIIAAIATFWPLCAHAAENDLNVSLPEGFSATLYADDALVPNVTAMTIDAKGRVVVSGPGYIKILHDDDGDGYARRATLFANRPASGAQGMVWDDNGGEPLLYCTGDDGLLLFTDRDGNDVADGPPQVAFTLAGGERGPHGICRGPDGAFYFVCGDAPQNPSPANGKSAPLVMAKTGGVYRTTLRSPDGAGLLAPQLEIIASGFNNPYDLAFHSSGALFTVDANDQRDVGLPWYRPTALYDVAVLRQHGRTADVGPPANRPAYYFDAVRPAAELGRGAPTGLTEYRHRQFPEEFRGGLFSACWLFGRVDYLKLTPQGASFMAERVPFLEFQGEVGLAPVDLAVGPEGDLFVACGGRGTRGAVIRVRHDAGSSHLKWAGRPAAGSVAAVLRSDQPMSAWSRARWVPAAREIGKDAFVQVIVDPQSALAEQLRAAEVVVELFGTITPSEARRAIALNRPELTARIAWLVERHSPWPEWWNLLCELTFDDRPQVQMAAWQGVSRRRLTSLIPTIALLNWNCWDDPRTDERVRDYIRAHWNTLQRPPPLEVATGSTEFSVRQAFERLTAAETQEAQQTFTAQADAAQQLRELRSIQRFYGDFQWADRTKGITAGYRRASNRAGGPISTTSAHAQALAAQLTEVFPTGRREVDREFARTLCIFDARPQAILPKLIEKSIAAADPDDALHYLIVASLMRHWRDPALTARTAAAICAVDAKLQARGLATDGARAEAQAELYRSFVEDDAALPEALVNDAAFGRAGHAVFVANLPANLRRDAAARIFAVVRRNHDEVVWTPQLIEVVGESDDAGAIELLRGLWKEPGLRDALFAVLARRYEVRDREKIVASLKSSDPAVVARAAYLLMRPSERSGAPEEIAAAVQGLRQMCTLVDAERARFGLLSLIEIWGGEFFRIKEPTPRDADRNVKLIRDAFQPVFLWFALRHYEAAATAAAPGGTTTNNWRKRLLQVDWDEGDVRRGQALFEKKLCSRCHLGDSRLGPDLDGVARRYSRSELFATIFEPSRFVPAKYRPTEVELQDGRTFAGLPVAEAHDVMLLQTGADAVVRLRTRDMAHRRTTTQSIMPLGLLNDFAPRDFADLYAFLRGL